MGVVNYIVPANNVSAFAYIVYQCAVEIITNINRLLEAGQFGLHVRHAVWSQQSNWACCRYQQTMQDGAI